MYDLARWRLPLAEESGRSSNRLAIAGRFSEQFASGPESAGSEIPSPEVDTRMAS